MARFDSNELVVDCYYVAYVDGVQESWWIEQNAVYSETNEAVLVAGGATYPK